MRCLSTSKVPSDLVRTMTSPYPIGAAAGAGVCDRHGSARLLHVPMTFSTSLPWNALALTQYISGDGGRPHYYRHRPRKRMAVPSQDRFCTSTVSQLHFCTTARRRTQPDRHSNFEPIRVPELRGARGSALPNRFSLQCCGHGNFSVLPEDGSVDTYSPRSPSSRTFQSSKESISGNTT